MNASEGAASQTGTLETLPERCRRIRAATLSLCRHLVPEDCVVQSMPDVSPTKWHLAHVTWFFEQFILVPHAAGYRVFDEHFYYLFNSYYYTAGDMHARPKRGLLSRPAVAEVLDYRRHVDEALGRLLERGCSEEIDFLVTLGLHHEQQHQELLLTDIKHVFSCNPMLPAASPELLPPPAYTPAPLGFHEGQSGIREIGATGDGFCFDNETPRHTTLLHPHRLGSRLITNAEYLQFIDDGGYGKPALWLSDGWATTRERGWSRPLYWGEDLQSEFTLAGLRDIDPAAPVTHVSYYEADAFARWAGARLPTEAEWEAAAANAERAGNFVRPVTGSPSLPAARSFSATSGNGPHRRTHPTPASRRLPVRSANTTASLCATR